MTVVVYVFLDTESHV